MFDIIWCLKIINYGQWQKKMQTWPDVFCYICEYFSTSKQEQKITDFVKQSIFIYKACIYVKLSENKFIIWTYFSLSFVACKLDDTFRIIVYLFFCHET